MLFAWRRFNSFAVDDMAMMSGWVNEFVKWICKWAINNHSGKKSWCCRSNFLPNRTSDSCFRWLHSLAAVLTVSILQRARHSIHACILGDHIFCRHGRVYCEQSVTWTDERPQSPQLTTNAIFIGYTRKMSTVGQPSRCLIISFDATR